MASNDQPFNTIPVEKLPVPPLQQTMEFFLKSAKPLLSESEYAVTKSLAHEFAKPGGDGERLQAVLEERAKTHDNWLSEWWLNHVYLDNRESLPINSNTAMTFNCKEVTSMEEQLQMAASYIAVCVDFKNILDQGKLPQDKLGPFALDMTQNYQEFNTCRIPGEKRDTLRQFQPSKRANHVVIIHNYHFFKLPVYGEDGSRLNHEQLIQQLRTIIAQSPDPSPHPVGILTAEKRDKWYRLRQELLKEAQNREALEAIETSIILISLDAKPGKVGSTKSERDLAAAMDMTHGGGCNTPNRWSDKILNGVVGWYCSIGMVGEHSAADGHAFSHCFNYIGANLEREDKSPPVAKFSPPTKLDFIVNAEIQKGIQDAKEFMKKQIDNCELDCYIFADYGSDAIKSMNLSPDSFIQMAIQLAYYRLHGAPSAQYETAVLRRFLHGRTETIRSCTEEAVQFCHAMMDASVTNQDKAKTLRAAVSAHKDLALLAVSGQGVDRHLFGMRLAAAQLGMEVPKLFLDPGYTRSGCYRVCTSQMPLFYSNFSIFGAVVPDGYGICYSPLKDKITFGITAYNSCAETDCVKFTESLAKSFLDMKNVLTNVQT